MTTSIEKLLSALKTYDITAANVEIFRITIKRYLCSDFVYLS
jgi:hypothetical protein